MPAAPIPDDRPHVLIVGGGFGGLAVARRLARAPVRVTILDRTTGSDKQSAKPVIKGERILEMRALLRAIPVTKSLTRYVVRVLRATHPDDKHTPDLVRRYVRFGGSPRGAQAMLLAARIHCVLRGGKSPSVDDVRAIAPSALRHRVILNFEGEAEGVDLEEVLAQVLKAVPTD